MYISTGHDVCPAILLCVCTVSRDRQDYYIPTKFTHVKRLKITRSISFWSIVISCLYLCSLSILLPHFCIIVLICGPLYVSKSNEHLSEFLVIPSAKGKLRTTLNIAPVIVVHEIYANDHGSPLLHLVPLAASSWNTVD
jgi:hypothetical protein